MVIQQEKYNTSMKFYQNARLRRMRAVAQTNTLGGAGAAQETYANVY